MLAACMVFSFTAEMDGDELRTIMAHMDSFLPTAANNNNNSSSTQVVSQHSTQDSMKSSAPYGYTHQLKQRELKTIIHEYAELQSVG